jgi:hypothetical protein
VSESAHQEEDMNDTQTGAAVTVEAIETAFDGRWGIWLSGTGRWWAARQHEPGAAGPDVTRPAGTSVQLVRADDPDQLRARIQEHEARPREASIRALGGSPAGRAIRGRGRGYVPG